MWTISKRSSPDGTPVPGDVVVSDDRRAVYRVHHDGSLRRVKNPAFLSQALARFDELYRRDHAAAEAIRLRLEHPLTHPGDQVSAGILAPEPLVTA